MSATTTPRRRSSRRPLTVEALARRYGVPATVILRELARTDRPDRGPLAPLNPGSQVPVYDGAAADRWWDTRRTDESRYRFGDRDPDARAAHAADTTNWRREIRRAEFGPQEQHTLFEHLRRGVSLADAAAAVAMSTVGIYGRARWDDSFADALDSVLAETCPRCVTATAKHGHCRACRHRHHPRHPSN